MYICTTEYHLSTCTQGASDPFSSFRHWATWHLKFWAEKTRHIYVYSDWSFPISWSRKNRYFVNWVEIFPLHHLELKFFILANLEIKHFLPGDLDLNIITFIWRLIRGIYYLNCLESSMPDVNACLAFFLCVTVIFAKIQIHGFKNVENKHHCVVLKLSLWSHRRVVR